MKSKVFDNLYDASREILDDFDVYGAVLQCDREGEYGPESAIEKLREACSKRNTSI